MAFRSIIWIGVWIVYLQGKTTMPRRTRIKNASPCLVGWLWARRSGACYVVPCGYSYGGMYAHCAVPFPM